MSQIGTNPALHSLITNISQLGSSRLDLPGVVDRAGESIVELLDAGVVEIRLGHRGDLDEGVFSFEKEIGLRGSGNLVYSRPIAVRDVDYGWLTIEAPVAGQDPEAIRLAFEVIRDLLARFAEVAWLASEQRRLQGEARDAAWHLKINKTLTRAAGLVAVHRAETPQEALHWLREESTRLQQPVWRLAERLIEGHLLEKSLQKPSSQGLLRRTA